MTVKRAMQARPGPAPVPSDADALTRQDVAFIALVTAVATAVRLLFPSVWSERDALGSVFYAGDVRAFTDFAAAIVSGLACGASAVLARLCGGRLALAAIAPLAVFHFGHTVQGTVANTEALYGLLLAALLSVLVLATRHGWLGVPELGARRFGAVAAIGALAGCAAVVRAEFLLGTALVGIVIVRCGAPPSRGLLVAAYAAGVAASLTPSTVAHWRSIDAFNTRHAARLAAPLPRLAPVTSYGAFSFALANHAEADGGPNSDHPLLVPANEDEEARLAAGLLDLSVASVHRLHVDGYGLGLRWWWEHPADALVLLGRKSRIAYGALALGYGPLDAPVGADGTRRRVDLVEPEVMWLAPLHLGLLILGGYQLRRRARVMAWLFAIPVVTLLASTWLFYGYVRMIVAYLPVLWVVQAVAIAALAERAGLARRLEARSLIAAAGILMLGLVAMSAAALRPRVAVLDGPRNEDGQVFVDETVRVRTQDPK